MNTPSNTFPKDAAFDSKEENAFTISFTVPQDLPHFEGHFPDHPLVPGVTQISWCLSSIEWARSTTISRYKIARFKFTKPILPNDDVVIAVTQKDLRYSFRISSNHESAASGSIQIDGHG